MLQEEQSAVFDDHADNLQNETLTAPPPKTWNTPPPNSVNSRANGSDNDLMGAGSPSPGAKAYTSEPGDATSGFHSQATAFLSTHEQPTSNAEPSSLPSTPHNSGIRRGPRLSSTPLYGPPPGANGTLDDMPSNIMTTPGHQQPQYPYQQQHPSYTDSAETSAKSPDFRKKRELPLIREETHVGSSSGPSGKNSPVDGSRASGGGKETPGRHGHRGGERSLHILQQQKRASTGPLLSSAAHNDSDVFTALPASSAMDDTHLAHGYQAAALTERALPAGRATSSDRLLHSMPADGRLRHVVRLRQDISPGSQGNR